MTVGQKIKKLRIEKGLTQKELADKLCVTFQTVSKWEKDENEPSIATVRELAKLFDCSMDYLLSEDDTVEVIEEPVVAPVVNTAEAEGAPKTIVIQQKELHVCARCGKEIEENDLVSVDATNKERYGSETRSASVDQTYYHKACLEEVKKAKAKAAARAKSAKISKSKKIHFGWSTFAGVLALVIALLVLLLVPACKEAIHPAVAVLISIVIGYGFFSALYCIISGSYICDVFMWCTGLTIKFPGLIFSLDFGGITWLIVVKIIFAVIAFLFGIFTSLLAVVLSVVLGMVSFPFVLIGNIRNNYYVN